MLSAASPSRGRFAVPAFNPTSKVFGTRVQTLETGEATVLDARGMGRIAVITEAGATATISRVDDLAAEEHTEGEMNQFDVTAATLEVWDVDWPFYRVSVAGGNARLAVL
jgi:hypothetical protein